MTPLLGDDAPFVLLDDARASGAAPARLYRAPVQIVATRKYSEVDAALDAIRLATQGGLHAAGYLAYEAGYALEKRLAKAVPAQSDTPLLWFGLFRTYETIEADAVESLLPDPAGAWIGTPKPTVDRATYEDRLARILSLIDAGDIYQANLTFPAQAAWAGDPLALYAGLRQRARCGYGGIVRTERDWILSLSPELFFAMDGSRIWTRPMKGTLPGDADPALLSADEKQRAENLMIVDLLRNDLSRIAAPGSVAVPELFRVETYPTVHQMTSLVTADVAVGRDAVDVLKSLFPCGSITGAPKVRAMEVIQEIESSPRGVYTGAIGRIDASANDAAFNVAIRTLRLDDHEAHMGLGSGVVADSTKSAEWAECHDKGAFVPSARQFDLIETMAFNPQDGIPRLEFHLERMKRSAAMLDFIFDRHAARNELQAATFRLRDAARVRLVLARSGVMAITTSALPSLPTESVSVLAVDMTVSNRDFRCAHKTTDRAFYDRPRLQAGAFEVVFVDPHGFVTEGSFTTIFVERDGQLLTPPLSRGVLPGVLRAELIDQGRAIEADLCLEDLKNGFFIGNALRGLLPARLTKL